jgi:pimeloyl-ACP methyl ester carboxylesterase
VNATYKADIVLAKAARHWRPKGGGSSVKRTLLAAKLLVLPGVYSVLAFTDDLGLHTQGGDNMSSKMSMHRVNGVELNVLDTGDGSPTLIFLHYWGGSIRSWEPVIRDLSKDQRCIAIDFRGWGKSSRDAKDYDVGTLADDVAAIIHKLGPKKFVILGHSMGGKVAQLVASTHPEGLQQLILMAPAPPQPLEVPTEQRRAMAASYETREGVMGIIAKLPLSQADREQIVDDALSGAPAAKRAWPEHGMAMDIREQASRIDVPVNIIVGSADVVETEAALREEFGKVLPPTEFTVLSGVSHMAPLEATSQVVDAIRSALTTEPRR